MKVIKNNKKEKQSVNKRTNGLKINGYKRYV